MQLGAGHPMGPLALLTSWASTSRWRSASDRADVPRGCETLVDEGALGRKCGRGFHAY